MHVGVFGAGMKIIKKDIGELRTYVVRSLEVIHRGDA